MGLFSSRDRTGNWLVDHSLSLVIIAIMAAQTAYALWSGAYVFVREEPFGKGVPAWGEEFWLWWSWQYNVSLVADTFGVLLIVVLSKFLYERGSAESNDPDEETPRNSG